MSLDVAKLMWRLDMPSSVKLVAVRLADYANDDGSNVYPGVERLADECGISQRSVQRHLRHFENLGILVVVANAGGGRGRATEFRIDVERVTQLCRPLKNKRVTPRAQRVTTETERVTTATVKGDTHVTPLVKEPSREPSGDNLTRDFREFYAAFPRKIGPDDAEKAYRVARKRASHDEIMAGTIRFAASVQGKDPQYIKTPGPWLRAGRWADEPDPPTNPASQPGISPLMQAAYELRNRH